MRKSLTQFFILAVLISVVAGCYRSEKAASAPVVNAWLQPSAASSDYVVKRGDTIYSIAWAFGLDYRTLARNNNIASPYNIEPGTRLRMTTVAYTPNQKTTPTVTLAKRAAPSVVQSQPSLPMSRPVSNWQWPAVGRVAQRYSPGLAGNHGLDIAGRYGEPVRAAAAGRVVYSGAGVRGYGNMVLIKHNDSYLSAYAYNQKNLVRVGQVVRQGQEIARMGRNNAGRVLLHFEIRQNGRPVNPIRYLG